MPIENEILDWNVKIVERHDQDIAHLKESCSEMKAELKVIKLLASILVTVLGLVGSVVFIVNMLKGAAQ